MKQEIASSLTSRSRKVWLLGTVSALAMCAAVLDPAWAAKSPFPGNPTTESEEGTVSVGGYTTVSSSPANTETTLSALIADDASQLSGAGTSATTAVNSFTATAGGNDVAHSVTDTTFSITGTTLALPNMSIGVNAQDGVVVLGNATNSAVAATATVANSSLFQQLAASVSAATVTGNSMAANVTLNQSSTTVQGQIPINYQSNPENYSGASSAANEGGPYDATASVLATTAQFNNASGQLAGSGAMLTESFIGQAVTGANNTADVMNGTPAVTGNSLTAGFAGNSSTSVLTIDAGVAPTFYGTAALTNVQQNSGDAGEGANPAAVVKYSYIQYELTPGSGTVELDTPASVTLNGALAITGNMITALATGNQAEVASPSGPTIGNVLTLAGGIGLQGTSGGEDDYVSTLFADGSPSIGVFGDAVVNNWQDNATAPLNAMVKQSSVLALLPVVDGGSVTLASNTIMAQTVGNQAYNALLAPGLGSPGTGSPLNGVLDVGSVQANQSSPLTATIFGPAGVAISAAGAINATLAVNANTVSASATGNSVTNTINLNASNLPSITDFPASTSVERNAGEEFTGTFGASADVVLNSQQTNDSNSPVVALNQNGGVSLDVLTGGDGVAGSALSVTGNTTAALATGNASTNGLTLTSASITASAALLGAQSSYGAVTATLTDPTTAIVVGPAEDPASSTLALDGNLQRAIATGNYATNALSVTGAAIAVADFGGPAATFTYEPGLAFPITSDGEITGPFAGFVASNDQATTAPVSAVLTFATPAGITTPTSGSMEIIVTDGLNASTADNSTNAVVSAARGNQASTLLTVSPSGSLTVQDGEEADYSPFAVVTNVQTLGNAATVTASIASDAEVKEGAPLPPIYTTVAGGMAGSTLTMTANQVAALAQGNNATNGLTLANAGTVTQPGGSQPLGLLVPPLSGIDTPSTTLTADAAFTVTNMQIGGTSAVTATQNATGVQANIAGDVSGSTVTIGGAAAPLGNVVSSTATTNLASNTLTLGAANLSASSGLLNFQVSNGAAGTTMGTPGSAPTPGSTNTVHAVTSNDDNGTFSGATTVDHETYQTYTGWLESTDPNSVEDGYTQGTAAGFTGDYFLHVVGLTIPEGPEYGVEQTYNNVVPGSPGSWGSPTFVIALNGNVSNSVLGVTQNTVTAAATANAATNTVAVNSAISSSSLSFDYEEAPASGFTGPGAFYNPTYGPIVLADVGLLNNQTLGAGASAVTTAYGSFGINNAAVAPVYTDTALTVGDNALQANATGNTATNVLTLSPGITIAETTPQTASIFSMQTASSGEEVPVVVTAGSTMLIGTPIALSGSAPGGSTLTVSGNANTATAVVNQVTNTLTVTGTSNLPGYNPGPGGLVQANPVTLSMLAYGNNTLVNTQTVANGAVQGTANTTVLNDDQELASVAIANTSVAVDSNTTLAQSLGNQAGNTLTITAAGSSGATGAVANGQINLAGIGAAATANTGFALNGNVSSSVIGITQNSLNATAIANTANNTVASTSATSSSLVTFANDVAPEEPGPGAALNPETGVSMLADIGLLNVQSLGATGSASATANGSIGISNAATLPVYTNATLSIGNNTQQASAVGNTATNSLTLSPGATPTTTVEEVTTSLQPLTASLVSVQSSGSGAEVPVSATSTMAIAAPMAMTGSTLTISGNTNTASAVANDVTNTLTVTGTTSLPGAITGQTGALTAERAAPFATAYGDYTLVNEQTVTGSEELTGGSVQSTATTTIGNNDLYLDPAAISGTTVSMDSNTTVAQSLGNRASNTLSITAAGSSGATGGIINGQINGSAIGAAATIDSTFALGQAEGVQVGSTSSNATYGITNNTTQALATANQATNALNAAPAAYGDATMPSGSAAKGPIVATGATYAVLNAQYNAGPVTATVNGSAPTLLPNAFGGSGGYVVALNTTGAGTVVNVSGNTVTSQAIGNRASNTITLAALNTGTATSSISSTQQNTGAISASISNVQVGGAVSAGTTARVGGNSLAASAFGNIATSSVVTH